jgi:hypothetical protein
VIWLVFFAAVAWLLITSRYSRQGVWFLLLWVPVQGWFQLNVFNDSSATVLIYEYLIIGIYIVFGVRALRAPQQYGPPAVVRFAIPFVAWTLLLVPSSLVSSGPILTLLALRTYLLPLPLVWIGYRTFVGRDQLETIAWLLMLQLVVIGGVAASQMIGISSVGGAIFEVPTGFGVAGVIRPPGTFSSPGHLGMYILFSVPFAFGLLALSAPLWMRAGFVAGLVGATIALFANTQRATIVLLAVTLPLIAVLARRRKAMSGMAIAIVIMAAASVIGNRIVGEAIQQRIDTIAFDFNNTLVLNPTERLVDALRTPVFGTGIGTAAPGASRLQPRNAMGSQQTLRTLITGESFMAALIYHGGVPALIFFYLFLGALMLEGLQSVRACRKTDMAVLTAGLLCFQVAIVIQSWAYDPLHYPPSRVLFWFWSGVLISLPRIATVRTAAAVPQRPAVPVRRLVRPQVALPSAVAANRARQSSPRG